MDAVFMLSWMRGVVCLIPCLTSSREIGNPKCMEITTGYISRTITDRGLPTVHTQVLRFVCWLIKFANFWSVCVCVVIVMPLFAQLLYIHIYKYIYIYIYIYTYIHTTFIYSAALADVSCAFTYVCACVRVVWYMCTNPCKHVNVCACKWLEFS